MLEIVWIPMVKKLNVDTLNDDELMQIFIFMDNNNKGVIEKKDFILFATMVLDDNHQMTKLQTDLIQALIKRKHMNE